MFVPYSVFHLHHLTTALPCIRALSDPLTHPLIRAAGSTQIRETKICTCYSNNLSVKEIDI